MDLLAQDREQHGVVNGVEASTDVALNEPRGSAPRMVNLPEGGVTSPLRSEAVGGQAELWLVVGFQEKTKHFLQQFVRPRRQAERENICQGFLCDVDVSPRSPREVSPGHVPKRNPECLQTHPL